MTYFHRYRFLYDMPYLTTVFYLLYLLLRQYLSECTCVSVCVRSR